MAFLAKILNDDFRRNHISITNKLSFFKKSFNRVDNRVDHLAPKSKISRSVLEK